MPTIHAHVLFSGHMSAAHFSPLCDGISTKMNTFTLFQCFRVVPITVILYRYIMVCHVDFCLEKGERKISKILLRASVVVPTLVASFSMFYLDNLRGYLVCSGREEILRFNTDNFFEDAFIGGVVILLPLHHPYRVFAIMLGRNFR